MGVVEDNGFKSLMKTGRPGYWIPSRSTVSRDIKSVFKNVRERAAKMLQVSQLVSCYGVDSRTHL